MSLSSPGSDEPPNTPCNRLGVVICVKVTYDDAATAYYQRPELPSAFRQDQEQPPFAMAGHFHRPANLAQGIDIIVTAGSVSIRIRQDDFSDAVRSQS